MRALETIDLAVIGAYLALVAIGGLMLTRRASQSMESFFIASRTLPWWLVGVSMAATNFSIDTPVAITKFVYSQGIGGVWFFWSSAISALLVTFLFAQLWRRSEVITDAEFIELRYGARPAAFLRLFKGFYFGVIFNAFIMGWVFLALTKVVRGVADVDPTVVLMVSTVLVFLYTVASGYYGVVVTDFFQYTVAFIGSVILAGFAVAEVGGLDALVLGVEKMEGTTGMLDFFPSVTEDGVMPLGALLVYLTVQWWAHKYADGGGKHIQRMLSARNENHAVAASFLFTFLNYALQVWPWILTALCGLILFGRLDDPEMAYPMVIARVLPSGILGLVLACLIGAFMSTIDTHLNLGASYIVNDIYRRFLKADGSDRHYVWVSRAVMAGLLGVSVIIAQNLDSVGGAWKFLLTFASGAGLTWIVRWFWWRPNAWTELSAMLTSGLSASLLSWLVPEWSYASKLVTTVGLSTVVWLSVTYATRPVDDEHLARFVAKIRPGSPGWAGVCARHGITPEPFLRRALVDCMIALIGLFSLNFGVGAVLLGRPLLAVTLLVLATFALTVLGVRRLGRRRLVASSGL